MNIYCWRVISCDWVWCEEWIQGALVMHIRLIVSLVRGGGFQSQGHGGMSYGGCIATEEMCEVWEIILAIIFSHQYELSWQLALHCTGTAFCFHTQCNTGFSFDPWLAVPPPKSSANWILKRSELAVSVNVLCTVPTITVFICYFLCPLAGVSVGARSGIGLHQQMCIAYRLHEITPCYACHVVNTMSKKRKLSLYKCPACLGWCTGLNVTVILMNLNARLLLNASRLQTPHCYTSPWKCYNKYTVPPSR